MHDGGKIIAGLIIFLVLVTFPIWYTMAGGNPDYRPDPKVMTDEKNCVESTEYMKAWHMDLLNEWRDIVVRDGERIHISSDGRKYEMSLTNTCLKCHSDKKAFCDQCHDYVGVSPYCWDCHIETEGD